jgi:hypothetical protein
MRERRVAGQRFSLLPAWCWSPAALFGLLWHRIAFENGNISIELAPLAYVFVAYVYFIFFYGSVVLLRKYGKYRGTQKGQQVGAILWGLG